YYEIHGTGKPLILLHGGLGAIEMFGDVLPQLAQRHQVIAVDLQGHGRTADVDRPLRHESMADNVAALIRYLGLRNADVMGYPPGGAVAVGAAIQHPEVVRKLVLVSTPFNKSGWYPELQAGQAQLGPEVAEAMRPTPLYAAYAALAPRPQDWPVLVTKLGDLLRQDYDWSAEVAVLWAPTMLVVGDADGVRTAHTVAFYELLGGGKADAGFDGSRMSVARLAILPGLTHYTIFSSPALASAVTPFLDAPTPTAA